MNPDEELVSFALPQCLDCRHLRGADVGNGWTCDAFPAGIPQDIFDGALHDEPREGDHGIQFEPKDHP